MKKLLFSAAFAAGLLMFSFIGVSSATSYNPTDDFSISNGNPNGVWTYGWMPSDLSAFNTHTTTVIVTNYQLWYTPMYENEYVPDIGINTSDSTFEGIAPGQLALHPGKGGEASVLRFTAPAGGIYDIDGEFFAGDTGIMKVGVRQGSGFIWNGNDYGSFFIDDKMLSAGDTVDFLVYTGTGGYTGGNTGLELTISAVPIPPAILLLGSGILGLGLFRRGHKR